MANEVTVVATLSYADAAGVSDSLSTKSGGFTATPSTLKCERVKQTINTSETALKLGDTTAPGYVFLKNLDATNYVEVKVAASGAVFAKLLPNGGAALLYLGSGAQAPVLIANSAACLIDALVIPA